MKKMMFFLLAAVLIAAYSCKRTDEVNPVPQTVGQPNDSLKIQNTYLVPTVIAGRYNVGGHVDGPALTARFLAPRGIFTKSDGSLLVTDGFYPNYGIRRISTDNIVSSPYHPTEYANDVAVLKDGAVGVVTSNHVIIYNHGTHVTRTISCFYCDAYSIDKDPSSTFFYYTRSNLDIETTSNIYSINESLGRPAPAIPFPGVINGISITANGNKFFTTDTEVLEYTSSGALLHILSGFYGLRGIIANHDGTKLYVVELRGITQITRCPTCKPVATLIVKGGEANGIALSNNEKTLYFTSEQHETVSKVALP